MDTRLEYLNYGPITQECSARLHPAKGEAMTPNDIEILIHFHMSPTRHPRQEFIKATIDWFLRADMIKPLADGDEPDLYQTTVKGAAHVKQLCTLPWPKQAWVGSDGKVIG